MGVEQGALLSGQVVRVGGQVLVAPQEGLIRVVLYGGLPQARGNGTAPNTTCFAERLNGRRSTMEADPPVRDVRR